MKHILNIIAIAALAAFTTGTALADAKVKAGPRKGRVLEMEKQNAELKEEIENLKSPKKDKSKKERKTRNARYACPNGCRWIF